MPSLEWHPHAVADLLTIVDHIAADNPPAAQALKDDIATRATRLIDQPKAYRKGRVPGTREMVIRPNYLLIYAESEQTITILRVLHAARQWP